MIGAEIFATIGFDSKKQLLVEEHGIPPDHIFYSRNTSFVKGIRRLTNGYGVDVDVVFTNTTHAQWETTIHSKPRSPVEELLAVLGLCCQMPSRGSTLPARSQVLIGAMTPATYAARGESLIADDILENPQSAPLTRSLIRRARAGTRREKTMPPHLHPRSRMTSSLFATTVAASFLVVGLPHILPCPAPRVAYADSASPDGSRRRTRRRSPQQTTQVKDGIAQFEGVKDNSSSRSEGTETSTMTGTAPRGKRECPVPKPGGVIGELMGFKKEEHSDMSRPGAEMPPKKKQ
ncbi:hypothetical protein HD806DRAFT_535255 [Xylariaceae sp. AK1471]|nr:hypothetical protein HD806DRAFT_535255 [Xylariaceae sp. AK1471]